MQSMKIIFNKNLGKLVLKIEIDLAREPKILSIMVICKKSIFSSCNTSINTHFRDFYDSEVRFSKKLFYHRFFVVEKNRVLTGL